MEKSHKTTGNIGEWSELYALGSILSNGGVFGANKDQEKIKELFYRVLKIVFFENQNHNKFEYFIGNKNVNLFLNNRKVKSIESKKIEKVLIKVFKELSVSNEGRAFNIKSGEEMMALLNKKVIKASSSDKKDLDLVMVDIKTGAPTPEIGFSIKSQLGSPSTLINASRATNFTFEVLDSEMKIPKGLPILHDKNVKDNINLLLDSGYKIIFNKVDSEIFQKNISLIDSSLPNYLADILLSYYSRNGNNMVDLVDITFSGNKNKFDQASHKIKEFLSIMALGMMPNTPWNGILTSLGGFLLVKKDGDVLCYYLYNMDSFQDYLINSTKLDTPSTTRYGIGKIIKENDRFYIKLNLQVRFIK